MKRSITACAILLQLFTSQPVHAIVPPARFQEHTIATDLKGGYQVVVADLNRDGRPDLIALGSGMSELVWFENPGWKRHVLASGLSRMINLAAWDTDGDGIPEIVLAHEFANDPAQSVGIVSLLRHRGDPTEPWQVTEIDRLPTSHRLRWCDIDGGGRKVLVNAPLAAASARPPDYRGKVPLVFYRPGSWKRELISDEIEGVLHGIFILDWDGNRREDILIASFLGIDLFRLGTNKQWKRTSLAAGNPAPWPKSGSSEIAVGWLGKERLLCTIEPWHGNQVVVYRQRKQSWDRQMIDDGLDDGHTLLAADLNHDGRDEIIAGYRGKGRSVYIYSADDPKGNRWTRQTLDNGGIAAAACTIADFNGDKRPDIACIGSATANLKWYENLGAWQQ
ncbi:MAG TPA: VCBS repeat-containing protein [Blastocatellia bacterium]|nr:VCBS repeat-containing protein [Blastocatellia bacterium]